MEKDIQGLDKLNFNKKRKLLIIIFFFLLILCGLFNKKLKATWDNVFGKGSVEISNDTKRDLGEKYFTLDSLSTELKNKSRQALEENNIDLKKKCDSLRNVIEEMKTEASKIVNKMNNYSAMSTTDKENLKTKINVFFSNVSEVDKEKIKIDGLFLPSPKPPVTASISLDENEELKKQLRKKETELNEERSTSSRLRSDKANLQEELFTIQEISDGYARELKLYKQMDTLNKKQIDTLKFAIVQNDIELKKALASRDEFKNKYDEELKKVKEINVIRNVFKPVDAKSRAKFEETYYSLKGVKKNGVKILLKLSSSLDTLELMRNSLEISIKFPVKHIENGITGFDTKVYKPRIEIGRDIPILLKKDEKDELYNGLYEMVVKYKNQIIAINDFIVEK